MQLSSAQQSSLVADIAANTNTVVYQGSTVQIKDLAKNSDTAAVVANWYNQLTGTDFWVYRTDVAEAEIFFTTSDQGTNFTFVGNGFIGRSAGEFEAWNKLFPNGRMDASRPNVRAAVSDVLSGTGNAAANRTHVAHITRRKTSNIERLFATGTGSTGSPGIMAVEGVLTGSDITLAWGV